MKILAIADCESKFLWDFFKPEKLDGIDLILSCGDLAPQYLSFLATFTHAPVLYVHGNHDDCYEKTNPDGCICIEDKIYLYQGIRIMGLGGSMRYKPGKNQYTDRGMNRRIRKLRLRLWYRKGFDILVTHAPAYGLHDGDDLPHRGFKGFVRLMEKYSPSYLVHGHIHAGYGSCFARFSAYRNTTIVNAYERCVFEFEIPGVISQGTL